MTIPPTPHTHAPQQPATGKTEKELDATREEYRLAEELLLKVRQAQRDSGKRMQGRLSLAEDVSEYIDTVKQQSGLIAAIAETYNLPQDTLYQLMARFEEMARRRKINVSNRLRPAIYKRLAVELVGNIEHFSATPDHYDDFISVTFQNGNVNDLPTRHIGGDESKPTYGDYFAGNEGIFKRAATGNPGDPAGFLDKVVDTITTLPEKHIKGDASQPTYGNYFAGNESILKRAATHNLGDPAGFLDKVVDNVAILRKVHPSLEPKEIIWLAVKNLTTIASERFQNAVNGRDGGQRDLH